MSSSLVDVKFPTDLNSCIQFMILKAETVLAFNSFYMKNIIR